jgi:hypothetical protein
MVRAILAGKKTQTRRIIKGEMWYNKPDYISDEVHFDFLKVTEKQRYGCAGDRLWVRETFYNDADAGDPPVWVYRADNPDYSLHDGSNWKPSIFMPRAASRITLEVADVRIERLQDISRDDAIAEGVYFSEQFGGYVTDDAGRNFHYSDPRITFCSLWCNINGPESWDDNPFVWVISFSKISEV